MAPTEQPKTGSPDPNYVKEPKEYNEVTVAEITPEDAQKLVDKMLTVKDIPVVECERNVKYKKDGKPLNGLYSD